MSFPKGYKNTPENEIKRLWPHRMGESYIRHLIRINVREIRLNNGIDAQLTQHRGWRNS